MGSRTTSRLYTHPNGFGLCNPTPPFEPQRTHAVSSAAFDYYLLAMAAAGSADFLVAGDKGGLLVLRQYAGCRIITVRDFLTLTRRLP
jgi:predicted nucleic acid-binding protein